ncbi:hypothetical protein ACFW9I_02595 [[Kitasatospora] papulosa]|uniref:hypothetical protein n=1 Tax=[Kitasatospora] papulosa TaxID=1464011 RepID=UPI0036B11FF8
MITDRSSLMPQYPHRPIVQAIDRLTEQVKRIADHLDTPAEEADAPLPPDNGRRVAHWLPVPDSRPPCIPDHSVPVHCPGCADPTP